MGSVIAKRWGAQSDASAGERGTGSRYGGSPEGDRESEQYESVHREDDEDKEEVGAIAYCGL